MESLLSLPPRSGDPTRDLEAIYKYLADLKFYLEGVLSDDTETELGGIGGDHKVVSDLVIPPIDFGAPTVPTGLLATGLYQAIGLTWQIIMDPTVAGYEVQRSDNLAFTANVLTLTRAKSLHFIDDLPGLNGVTRYYRIQALRGTTTLTPSGFTAVVSATTRPAAEALIAAEEFGTALQSLHLKHAVIETAHLGDVVINNAQIADGSITTAKIADLAVTTAKIAIANITTALIQDLAVNSAKINDAAIITAKIADAAIVSAKILDLAVNTAKIADLAVSRAKLANLAVDTAKIENLAVTEGKIADLAVTTAKIADAAITTAKIGTAVIGSAQIADGSITSAKIQDASITNADIQDATITGAKIATATIGSAQIMDASITSADIQSLIVDKLTSGTMSSVVIDIANTFGVAPMIRFAAPAADTNAPYQFIMDANGAYRVWLGNLRAFLGPGSAKYGLIVWNSAGQMQFNTEDGGILAQGIKDGAVGEFKIAAGAIVESKLRDGSISNAKMQSASIGTANIIDGSITSAKIGSAQITDAQIQTLSATKITTGKLDATGGITVGAPSGSGQILLAGQAYDPTNAPYIYFVDQGGAGRVLLGKLSAGGVGGTQGWGLLVWNASGQIQFNTQAGGAQSGGVATGAINTGHLSSGAVTQGIYGSGAGGLTLSTSFNNVSPSGVSITTLGGSVQVTAQVYIVCTTAATGTIGAEARIYHEGSGGSSVVSQFQLPSGVVNVGVTMPLVMWHTPGAGFNRWYLQARQVSFGGGGQMQSGAWGGSVTEFKK